MNVQRTLLASLLCLILGFIGEASAAIAQTPLPARDNYLLLDSRIVEFASHTRLSVGTVVKHPANPLFGEDKPWEIRFDNLYANVFYDPAAKLYKCWYSPFINDVRIKPPMDRWDEVSYGAALSKVRDHGGREMGICYATSRDGIQWEKPELGLLEFDGSTANNLVLRGPHGAGLFRDTRADDPLRRHKLFYKGSGSMKVRFSPDGLHWSDELAAAGIKVPGDTHNNAFWSPERKRYVGITRMKKGQRLVARTESADFEHWTAAVEVMRGDVKNQTYAMPTFRHAGVCLGLVMVLRQKDDRVHCELAWSPDTVEWNRIDPGAPLIPLSDKRGDYDWGCAYAAAYPVVLPDGRIRLYYGASNGRHTSWRDGFLALATLRPDGWAGFEWDGRSPSGTGVVQTSLLTCSGNTLRVTADAKNGSVIVTALDVGGKALARSEELTGDLTATQVKWPPPFNLSDHKDKPIRFNFTLGQNAKLYSFKFTP